MSTGRPLSRCGHTIILVFLGIMLIVPSALPAWGAPTREVTGRTAASTGLLQSASFTTVEVHDQDKDGKDEIYLGGAGRSNPRTQGLHAYEYSTSTASWSAFGSGLPGTSSGRYFGGLGLGDVNGDGWMDIAAPVPTAWYADSTNAVYVYTSSATSAFTLAHTFSPGESTNEAEIADMDGDSKNDIIFSTYSGIEVHFGSGSATSWTESSPPSANHEIDGIGVGDLNNDALLDMVCTPYFDSDNKVHLYVQGSSRSWSEVSFVTTPGEAFGIKIVDLNGDGNNDVVYGSRSEGVKARTGNGGGTTGGTSFSWSDVSSGLPTSGGDWAQLELGDVDNDGDLDIITISSGAGRARIFCNNLPSAWTELFGSSAEYLTVGGNGYGANFGDWDGDTYLDCAACSWGGGVDAWIINRNIGPPPVNARPMPAAGEDVTIILGDTVQLDGTGSTDAEDAPAGDATGTALTYEWNVTSYPGGSSIRDSSLSPSDDAAEPSFVPDVVGTYTITLAVMDQDGAWSNGTDEDEVLVRVEKVNDPPIADAGMDTSGFVNEPVELNGSASLDPDGTIVYWDWSCTSHSVAIEGDGTAKPTFMPTLSGTFIFTLRVRDDNDTWSAQPDTVRATIIEHGENLPPVADAGPDMSGITGENVTLDGSGSFDLDGSIITWLWECDSVITVEFENENSSSPSFVPLVSGTYVLTLRVKDNNGSWSDPDEATISVFDPYFNPRPVADAGDDISAETGDLVTLDGRGSSDQNGYIVGYNWTCTSHSVTFQDRNSARPSFVPAEAGAYTITLAVQDDEGAWSAEDGVTVTVTEPPVFKFDVDIGPFLYNDSSPVVGATVRLALGTSTTTSATGNDGNAVFRDMAPGTYACTLEVNGSVVVGPITVIIDDDGTVAYPSGPIPKLQKEVPSDDDDDISGPDDDDDGTGSGFLLIALIIAVLFVLFLVIAVVLAFVLISKKKGDNKEKEKGDDEGEKEDKMDPPCPQCGSPMKLNDDFGRLQCTACGRFE